MSSLAPVDQIDGSFVPATQPGVASVELDGEFVLATPDGRTFSLNATGAIVWRCFDGVATIDELADDVSEAFRAPRDQVAQDVLDLVRQLGRAGLLAGVASQHIVHGPPDAVVLTPGTPVELTLPDLEGRTVSARSLRGQQVLLVNWSPSCGFCSEIAPQLAELGPALRLRDTALVLAASGSAAENRELVEASTLNGTVLLQDGEPLEAFTGQGTPAAYLVDGDGRVASELALGADEVLALARRVAQVPERGDEAAGRPRFLPEPPSS
jgi:thiol-disulfide isomerase/thioredoxin